MLCKDSDCEFKKQCWNMIPSIMPSCEIEKCNYYRKNKLLQVSSLEQKQKVDI